MNLFSRRHLRVDTEWPQSNEIRQVDRPCGVLLCPPNFARIGRQGCALSACKQITPLWSSKGHRPSGSSYTLKILQVDVFHDDPNTFASFDSIMGSGGLCARDFISTKAPSAGYCPLSKRLYLRIYATDCETLSTDR